MSSCKNLTLLFFIIAGLLTTHPARAITDTLQFKPALTRLQQFGDSLLKGSNDSIRLSSHQHFALLADSILRLDSSSQLSFYQVRSLSVLKDPEGRFTFYQWMLPTIDGNNFSFYGYVRVNDLKKKVSRIYKLNSDQPSDNEAAGYRKTDTSNWYGCIFYSVIHKRYKKKDSYLLLGWAPHTSSSTRKVIESFNVSGTKPVFGPPVIKTSGRIRSRIVFEYNSAAQMSLRYQPDRSMVVFDHLAPSDPRPESKGTFSLYGPDLSYDALKFNKGTWVLVQDIQVENDSKNEGRDGNVNRKLRITR